MKRILATVALAATLTAGSATAAAADDYKIQPIGSRTITTVLTPDQDPVWTCIGALKWAHVKPTTARIAEARLVCDEAITTRREAKQVKRWIKRHASAWGFKILGSAIS